MTVDELLEDNLVIPLPIGGDDTPGEDDPNERDAIVDDPRIDAFFENPNFRWNNNSPMGTPVTVTYSFARELPEHWKQSTRPVDILIGERFKVVEESTRAVYRDVFNDIEQWSNLTFREVPDTPTSFGQMRIWHWQQDSRIPFGGLGYLPYSTDPAVTPPGDLLIADTGNAAFWEKGQFGYFVLVHEVGHGLGLKHPNRYGAGDTVPFLPADVVDNANSSAMTYTFQLQNVERVDFGPLDTLALRHYYGTKPMATGNTVYQMDDSAGRTRDLIIDDGGKDTIDVSAATLAATIDLRGGLNFSSVGKTPSAEAALNNRQILETSVIENVIGTSFADRIIGNKANNVITTNGGADTVEGGAGVDTVVLNAARSAASFAPAGQAIGVTVGGVTVAATEVERYRFNDQILALDVADGQNAGTVYRAYQAAFNRTPDLAGLSVWVNQLDNGMPLTEVTRYFTISDEFKRIYGERPTNQQIVDQFYQNVLGRPGETAGINFWLGQLNGGTSVATALSFFANGPENIARVAPSIANGITLDQSLFALV